MVETEIDAPMRVARHGRSIVLVVPPSEARRARLRPGQRVRARVVPEPEEPWLGSWKKYRTTPKQWADLEKGMWD